MRQRALIIPAIKKNAVIPDQLVKKLAGKTLIQRALDTARQVVDGKDTLIVTDSDEIRLICERAGVLCEYNPSHSIHSLDIVSALGPVLEDLALRYAHLIIYRASSPLITARDIEDAYMHFLAGQSDCLVTVKSLKYRLWEERGQDLNALLFNEEQTAYIETRALFMLRANALTAGLALKATPYFLHDRSIEITSYQDWWVCEKLLQSKHLVFVVAGYPAIGMGHIYRALMLAHEISDHRITFLCTRESELALSSIAARDYRTKVQSTDNLADDVLRQRPDLVINDILDTEAAYVEALKAGGALVVNFEDNGPGACKADLVVNALYEHEKKDPRFLDGYRNFCLRDEFVQAERNVFRTEVKRLLITFGGTDSSNFTGKTLELLFATFQKRGISISLVAGPGYAHKKTLTKRIDELNALCSGNLQISFTYASNTMSREMENTDLAICSAGRTVYELAHMRVPSIVLSHHAREDMHTFARPRNGFLYLGGMGKYRPEAVYKALHRLLDPAYRHILFKRMSRFDFSENKTHVVHKILALLQKKQSLPYQGKTYDENYNTL